VEDPKHLPNGATGFSTIFGEVRREFHDFAHIAQSAFRRRFGMIGLKCDFLNQYDVISRDRSLALQPRPSRQIRTLNAEKNISAWKTPGQTIGELQ